MTRMDANEEGWERGFGNSEAGLNGAFLFCLLFALIRVIRGQSLLEFGGRFSFFAKVEAKGFCCLFLGEGQPLVL